MDINLLIFKDCQWVYRSGNQHELVGNCAALLGWDLYLFDRWLFDSQNWSMYTRRRQDLIALRTELAMAYGKTSDQQARDLLIVNYCMRAWKSTRALERRESLEVQALECANVRAKALHKTLKLAGSARKTLPLRNVMSGAQAQHTLAYGL